MKHARDPLSGVSVQMDITARPNGAAELMLARNGTKLFIIVEGKRLERARQAFEQADVEAFGELMFPTQLTGQEAA